MSKKAPPPYQTTPLSLSNHKQHVSTEMQRYTRACTWHGVETPASKDRGTNPGYLHPPGLGQLHESCIEKLHQSMGKRGTSQAPVGTGSSREAGFHKFRSDILVIVK